MTEEKLHLSKIGRIHILYNSCEDKLFGSIIPNIGDPILFYIDNTGRVEINNGEYLLHTGMEKKTIEHMFSRFYGNLGFYWSFNATAYIERKNYE